MEKVRPLTTLALPFSLVCIAAAIAYFSYAVIRVVEEAPAIIEQVESTTRAIDPVVDEVAIITALIPDIVDEVGLVREQITPILTEVEALRLELPTLLAEVEQIRLAIPPVLDEVEQVRLAIPPVLEEVANVRGELPAIVAESEGYRTLVPEVLAEVEATREMIPPTMAKAEVLINKASVAGKKASEGAVTGFFTGIIKAPFKMVSGASSSVFGSQKGLNSTDIDLLQGTALKLLNEAPVGSEESWENKKTKAKGTIKVEKEFVESGNPCRQLWIKTLKEKKELDNSRYRVCLDDQGSWAVVK
ncbi:hypothetical protein [Oceanicoccus sagamiensis]|nr:hypothetical protein [Oceanicoccus sagamiensis]